MITFCNSYALWLLPCVQLRLVTVTFCDINVVWCYVLSQYLCSTLTCLHHKRPELHQDLYGRVYTTKACAAPGRVYTTKACAAPWLVYTAEACPSYRGVYTTDALAVSGLVCSTEAFAAPGGAYTTEAWDVHVRVYTGEACDLLFCFCPDQVHSFPNATFQARLRITVQKKKASAAQSLPCKKWCPEAFLICYTFSCI
jgi:hypothetical protein